MHHRRLVFARPIRQGAIAVAAVLGALTMVLARDVVIRHPAEISVERPTSGEPASTDDSEAASTRTEVAAAVQETGSTPVPTQFPPSSSDAPPPRRGRPTTRILPSPMPGESRDPSAPSLEALDVSQLANHSGVAVTVQATGCTNGGVADVAVTNGSWTGRSGARSDDGGAWTVELLIPFGQPVGNYLVTATCRDQFSYPIYVFTPIGLEGAPLGPATPRARPVEITGHGCANAAVLVAPGGDPDSSLEVRADPTGSWLVIAEIDPTASGAGALSASCGELDYQPVLVRTRSENDLPAIDLGVPGPQTPIPDDATIRVSLNELPGVSFLELRGEGCAGPSVSLVLQPADGLPQSHARRPDDDGGFQVTFPIPVSIGAGAYHRIESTCATFAYPTVLVPA